ncbi:hypothetical protein K435DRAFT_804778 [Dendrothele bispora CBS 962.96]|uniref:Uncharacterized protein n=1 Tax=Dendrothele bispora (strain CBS 962.96) TaxID=1314807 RepID=A0A4S8LD38_DENBC|nr:hypothetical protein K435DRAFT_804778 [Dendrothele bispora CBS 962.96]
MALYRPALYRPDFFSALWLFSDNSYSPPLTRYYLFQTAFCPYESTDSTDKRKTTSSRPAGVGKKMVETVAKVLHTVTYKSQPRDRPTLQPRHATRSIATTLLAIVLLVGNEEFFLSPMAFVKPLKVGTYPGIESVLHA